MKKRRTTWINWEEAQGSAGNRRKSPGWGELVCSDNQLLVAPMTTEKTSSWPCRPWSRGLTGKGLSVRLISSVFALYWHGHSRSVLLHSILAQASLNTSCQSVRCPYWRRSAQPDIWVKVSVLSYCLCLLLCSGALSKNIIRGQSGFRAVSDTHFTCTWEDTQVGSCT